MTTATKLEYLDHFASQSIFRVLLETLSRPGLVAQLVPTELGALALALALGDVHTDIAVCASEETQQEIVWATGATLTSLDRAELVACCEGVDAASIRALRRGTAVAPELGAKIAINCHALHADEDGELTLTLSGPGVDGTRTLGIDGLARDVVDAIIEVNAHFPAGVDVWLTDERGRVAALPRSCRVEVR